MLTSMRVFLVHVRDPQFYAIPRHERGPNGRLRVMGFPPIGIMSLSSVLKRAGHECVMFDQANPETPNDVIVREIQRQTPDLVGLSFLSTTSYPYAKMLAREIRAASTEVKIAFGGVFATLNAQLIKLQCPEVDFVCRGDGEQLILDLLDRLDDPETVGGVTWRDKAGKLRHNANRPLSRDLDQWPFPDRESLPLDFVESMPLDVPAVLSLDRFTTMQTSRGCPWPCVFCDIPIFNEGKWRSRSPAHVIAEFEQLQKDGYGAVYFVDDHFLLQPKRIEAICKGIVENGITIEWGCEGRVDSTCAELFPAMAEAHCRTLMFGIESGSQKVLDRLKKEQTLAEVEAAVNKAKDAGIQIVHGFFVVGNPDETEEDMRETFRFASKLRHRQLRLQSPLRLSRHALVVGVREARPGRRRRRLVQVLQVLVHRSHRASRRGHPSRPVRGYAPPHHLQVPPLSVADLQVAPPLRPLHAPPRRPVPPGEAVPGGQEGVHEGGGHLSGRGARRHEERRRGDDPGRR